MEHEVELPQHIWDLIALLRKESRDYRRQRNGARRDADRLRAEVKELKELLVKAGR